jgi:uncharacterized SAM-dependent methyltransferase
VSTREQTFRLNGHCFEFKKGETLHTENSYKYSPGEFIGLAAKNGFTQMRHWVGDDGLLAVYLLAVA